MSGSIKMEKHYFEILDENGDLVLTITSDFTNLGFTAYFKQHIKPLLKAIAKTHNKDRVYYM